VEDRVGNIAEVIDDSLAGGSEHVIDVGAPVLNPRNEVAQGLQIGAVESGTHQFGCGTNQVEIIGCGSHRRARIDKQTGRIDRMAIVCELIHGRKILGLTDEWAKSEHV
jgi:hypothetical protein